MRRRTYRAHGRVNAYMSSPAHIQIMVEDNSDAVTKEVTKANVKLTAKQVAQGRKVPVGGN